MKQVRKIKNIFCFLNLIWSQKQIILQVLAPSGLSFPIVLYIWTTLKFHRPLKGQADKVFSFCLLIFSIISFLIPWTLSDMVSFSSAFTLTDSFFLVRVSQGDEIISNSIMHHIRLFQHSRGYLDIIARQCSSCNNLNIVLK